MFREKLTRIQATNSSRLCVGLDPDPTRLPKPSVSDDNQIFAFNKAIIDATHDLVCSYKLNFAFYEQCGIQGLEALRRTLEYIPDEIVVIADAKRGDIGNTAAAYARSIFESSDFDAVTVNPYMGRDSVRPFLEYANKMTFVLALTSNPGSSDFQRLKSDDLPLYVHVVRKSLSWTQKDNIGFVVGATHPMELEALRNEAADVPFLIPGIGSQGGDAQATMAANGSAPAIVNVSRGVLYAGVGPDFASDARAAALRYRQQIG